MRLIFSNTDHLNTDITDEQGNRYYTVATPLRLHRVTTVTKYHWNGQSTVPETMGLIEWHLMKKDVFHWDGKALPADEMLQRRTWETGRYFVGPDGQTYKWKIDPHCWMKVPKSDVELVRFHEKNFGILKASHPPFLDVSPQVVSMLDYIILTFLYVEWLRQKSQQQSS